MFTYFVKNKHGYVTVMLIAMLISVLFINTTFMEIGRYRSIEKLFGEIQENAAFSVLANYDRDLLENFGLLAVEDDIDSEKFNEYLMANINGISAEDINKVDAFLGGSEVRADLQKLFFLSQRNVFQNQVNEFCAYRAPVAIINNGLDIETTLQKLIDDLEASLGALESFNQFAQAADKTLDAYQGMINYANQLADEYLPAVSNLIEAINSFNEAVAKREELKKQIEEQIKANEEAEADGRYDDVVDVSAMEAQLPNLYVEVEKMAKALEDAIDTMSEAIDNYEEIHKNFSDAFTAMKEAESGWSLEEAKANQSTGEMAQTMQETYDESKEETQTAVDKMEPYDEGFFEGVKGQMEQTKSQLTGSGESMGEIAIDTENPYNVLMDGNAKEVEIQLRQDIEEAEQSLQETENNDEDGSISFGDIVKVTKLLVEITVCGGQFNIDCNEVINVDTVNFTNVQNSYDSADQSYVNGLLSDVEATLGVEIDTDEEHYGKQTYGELESALQELSRTSGSLQEAFQSFELSGFDLLETIEELGNVLSSIISFFKAAIDAVHALIKHAVDGLMQVICQKAFAATYATEMFTNRSSSFEEDRRMNGSEYTDYGDDTNHEVFVMANAEYVYGGSRSEILNQQLAFLSIYGLRIFANIPAILLDNNLRTVSQAIAEIPYVGPVLAVALYVLIILAEAYLDMIFMIYGEEGVSIVKKDGYLNFSGKGVDELIEQIEGMIDKLGLGGDEGTSDSAGASVTKSLKESWKGTLEEATEGLTRWNYKDHLFVVLCLFKSSRTMYQNEASLIQMQMDKEKDEEFRLANMATFVRTDATVTYKPLLPVPYYGDGIPIRKLYYTGY